jgi:hypothetical protein
LRGLGEREEQQGNDRDRDEHEAIVQRGPAWLPSSLDGARNDPERVEGRCGNQT